jgi:hypothetical protein
VASATLIASSDDFLLEERLRETVSIVCAEHGGVEAEELPVDITPENLAVELCSPSLFASQRVLVASETRTWLDIPAKRWPEPKAAEQAVIDSTPVVRVLGKGLAEGIALVMGACCHSKPKGELVAAVEATGRFLWEPAPEPPKPWEESVLSKEQERVLREVLTRASGGVRFEPDAERLLLDRLGFAPRLLAQEGRKLAAASRGGAVDEDLVRALVLPKERSLDAARDALCDRRVAPLLDLLGAAAAGLPVRDLRGQLIKSEAVPVVVLALASSTFQKLLYLRRLAGQEGLIDEMSPERTAGAYWYPRLFKERIGPGLVKSIEDDAPSPLVPPGSKTPTLFALGPLFRGAGRYSDRELVEALAALGKVETALRGDMSTEALSAWITSVLD